MKPTVSFLAMAAASLLCACDKDMTAANDNTPSASSALSAVQDCTKQMHECAAMAKTADDRKACSTQLRTCLQPLAGGTSGGLTLDGGATIPPSGAGMTPPTAGLSAQDAGVSGIGAGLPDIGAGLPGIGGGLPSIGGGLPGIGGGLSGIGGGLPTADAGLPSVGAGLPTVGAGLPTIDAGLPTVDAGLPTVTPATNKPMGLLGCLGTLKDCLGTSNDDPMTCAAQVESCLESII